MGCSVGKHVDRVNPQSHGQPVESQDENYSKRHEISKTKSLKMCVDENPSIDRNTMNGSTSRADFVKKQDSKHDNGHMQVSSSQVKKELPPLRETADKWIPKAVAFDINFQDMDVNSQSTPRKFPRRLKKLEGTSPLTAEQLRKKQELADVNRSKELQRKTETSSRHNRNLFQVRERERLKNAQIKLERKFLASDRNRHDHVNKVIKKQQEREQKAKKVREKSRVELEGSVIHVDETYSSGSTSEDESWGAQQVGQQDEEIGAEVQDESSPDEFFERIRVRGHLNKIDTLTGGFFFL